MRALRRQCRHRPPRRQQRRLTKSRIRMKSEESAIFLVMIIINLTVELREVKLIPYANIVTKNLLLCVMISFFSELPDGTEK
jgi:hypothetical protein